MRSSALRVRIECHLQSRTRRSRIRRQAPAEVEEESDDEEGGVSSDDDEGGVSSDDEGESSDEEGEEEEEEEEENENAGTGGSATATSSSTSPTSTVTSSTTPSGSTSITVTSSSGATSVIVAPAPTATGIPNPNSPLNGISLNQATNSPHSMRCIYSISWLEETLHDSQREDAATMFFQVWLFGLSLVAVSYAPSLVLCTDINSSEYRSSTSHSLILGLHLLATSSRLAGRAHGSWAHSP